MQDTHPAIAVVLPKGEGFSPQQFGAISLCVRDFTHASRFKDSTTIIGGIASDGFDGIAYETPASARWFENRSRAYARGAAGIMNRKNVALAELHNRPVVAPMIAKRTRCRIALHLHNDPQEMDGTRTAGDRSRMLAMCAGVYCVSEYIRGRFNEGLSYAETAKVHVVYNGIELPDKLPTKENRIVFAGRMTEGKGALLLAKALTMALPGLPDWKATIIGSQRHEARAVVGTYERNVHETLALLPQVELAGFLSHDGTLAQFARASIAVVPSVWQEPFGRTALEAMAYGCATISSGRGGLIEVTGDASLTLETLTPESLAQAITHLAWDQSERERLIAAGRARARHFSIDKCAAALDAARETILSQKVQHAA